MQLNVWLLLIHTAMAVIKIQRPLDDPLQKIALPVNKVVGTKDLTLCLQVFAEKIHELVTFFSEETDQVKLDIRFNQNYGFFYLNASRLIFKIPQNTFHPFAWFHICFTTNSSHYAVVSLGKLWYFYERPNFKPIQDEIYLKNFVFGINPATQVSEVNIWSKMFDPIEIIELTKDCSKNYPSEPDILNWLKVSKGSLQTNDPSQIIDVNSSNICHSSPYQRDILIPVR